MAWTWFCPGFVRYSWPNLTNFQYSAFCYLFFYWKSPFGRTVFIIHVGRKCRSPGRRISEPTIFFCQIGHFIIPVTACPFRFMDFDLSKVICRSIWPQAVNTYFWLASSRIWEHHLASLLLWSMVITIQAFYWHSILNWKLCFSSSYPSRWLSSISCSTPSASNWPPSFQYYTLWSTHFQIHYLFFLHLSPIFLWCSDCTSYFAFYSSHSFSIPAPTLRRWAARFCRIALWYVSSCWACIFCLAAEICHGIVLVYMASWTLWIYGFYSCLLKYKRWTIK